MDALREWMESDLDVIMVGTWMHCESTETANDEQPVKMQAQQQKTTNDP